MKDMRNFFILELFILICLSLSASILSAGEVFHVDESTKVKEDLVLIGKSCVMEGKVNGDVVIINGDLDLYGNVNGDAVVINGKATLYGGSKVNGDLVIVGGELERAEGANVGGEVVITSVGPARHLFKLIPRVTVFSPEVGEVKVEVPEVKIPEIKIGKEDITKPIRPKVKHMYKGRVESGFPPLILLVWGIVLSTVIMILTAIFPSGSETMTLYLEKKPGRSFFTGFLAQILFVPAIIFLALSILGIPIIPFFILAYPIALLIALVPSSLFTGKIITRDSASFHKKKYLLSFIGLFILFVLLFLGRLLQIGGSVLNVIGLILFILTLFISYLYFTFGLGSLILSKFGTRKP